MDSKLLSEKHFSFNKFCPAGEVVSYQDVWRPSSMTLRQVQVQREEIIKTLFSIISNKKEINEVDKIMSPKVNLWMDNKPFWGRRFWKIWVLYLQNYKGFKDLTLSAEQLSHSEGQVNVIARWSAEKNGELAKSNDVIGTCYFKNEKLVRIESKAINYTFILGDNFKYSLNFLLRMPVILLWYVRNIKLHYPQRLPRW